MDKNSENILSDLFRTLGQTVQLRKREIFAKQGQNLQSVGLVLSGGFKLIYKQNKKVWIKSFVFEGGLIGSIPSLLQNKPIPYEIQSLGKSEVIVIPSQILVQNLAKSNQYHLILNDFLSDLYLKKEERVADFLLLEPEERYKKFVMQYNLHLNKISQMDQAAYLGITNVALSRIKARVFPSLQK